MPVIKLKTWVAHTTTRNLSPGNILKNMKRIDALISVIQRLYSISWIYKLYQLLATPSFAKGMRSDTKKKWLICLKDNVQTSLPTPFFSAETRC